MDGELGISEAVIQAIHAATSPVKIVIAMAGSGTQAIAELMRFGNGSATLLSQHLLYDNAAFNSYIGGRPDKYVSAWASRQLAMAAYMESRKMTGGKNPTAGIGCTSSLVKPDGERDGREHLIFVSRQDADQTQTFSLRLDPSLRRSRVEEERINAVAILQTVAEARGASASFGDRTNQLLGPGDDAQMETSTIRDPNLNDVLHGIRPAVVHGGSLPASPCVICSGSFNPLHAAHVRLLKIGERQTALPGVFEMSITNVDKPPMDFIEIERRVRQFDELKIPLVITNLPRYLEKLESFQRGSAFVMGADTFARLVNLTYYGPNEDPISRFEKLGARFIVAARRGEDGGVVTGEMILQNLVNASDRARWSKLSVFIPQSEFLMDLSSSGIRNQR